MLVNVMLCPLRFACARTSWDPGPWTNMVHSRARNAQEIQEITIIRESPLGSGTCQKT